MGCGRDIALYGSLCMIASYHRSEILEAVIEGEKEKENERERE